MREQEQTGSEGTGTDREWGNRNRQGVGEQEQTGSEGTGTDRE